MYVIQQAKQQILQDVKKAVGKGYTPSIDELSTPPDEKMGDIAFPCFVIAKGLKKNPAELATELAAKIGPKGFVKKIEAAGPYVNFTFDDKVFGTDLLEEILKQKGKYGSSAVGKGKKVLVEFANVNTHKILHIGHLRNFFVGQMTVNLLKVNGHEVIPGFYINDLGTHVAKCIWALAKFHEGEEPAENDRMSLLLDAYVEATKKSEKSKKAKKEIASVFKDLENLKGPNVSLWRKTKKWSMDYFWSIFKELELTIEFRYFESDLIADTKQVIEDLIEKGIAVHSEGAWIIDLQDENLGVNLLVKSDGTLLYNAKDLALAYKKDEDYRPNRSIIVVDARQSHVMKQLFATMKRIGFTGDMSHLSYEFVTLKEGVMASRKGNVIRYEDFRDQLIEIATKETKERHEDWDDKRIEIAARGIAFAAMRFGMLKQDREKKIMFDLEEALSFDGFTGPYMLYTYARIKSIQKKAGKMKSSKQISEPSHPVEHELITILSKYPEVVFRAAETMHLSSVAQYMFELCKTFSEYYNEVPILQADDQLKKERLALIGSVAQVLDNGFALLGIRPLEEM